MPPDGSFSLQRNVSSRTVVKYESGSTTQPRLGPMYFICDNKADRSTYDRTILDRVVEYSYRSHFDEIAQRWLDETGWMSSIGAITRHPGYRQIVDLGIPAAKFALERLARGDVRVQWFPVLRDVTGTDPVPREARGDVPAMTEAWVAWGRARGLIG